MNPTPPWSKPNIQTTPFSNPPTAASSWSSSSSKFQQTPFSGVSAPWAQQIPAPAAPWTQPAWAAQPPPPQPSPWSQTAPPPPTTTMDAGFGGNISAGVADEFADDAPLLEELGIDIGGVVGDLKSTVLMKPLMAKDLTGPFLVLLSLIFVLAVNGKYHLNFVYSISILGALFTYLLINVMNNKGIEFYSVCSVMGYGLAPLVVLAFLNTFMALNTAIGALICTAFVLFSTLHVTRNLSENLDLKNQRWLVAYPIGLVYGAFAIVVVL